MILSIIIAAAENNAIGLNNQLLWHLPNDMKMFKSITTGNTVIMGRKTYESIGKPLPNRRNIVISRNTELQIEGCEVVNSLDEALRISSRDKMVFVIGGGQIYRQIWDKADRLYLTRVHTFIDEADTFMPGIWTEDWHLRSSEHHPADEKHPYAYSFFEYVRRY